MLIDTHAHLFFPNFENDLDEVINRAHNEGIDYIIVPATDIKTAHQVLELCDKYDFIYGAVGVHPHDTKDWNSSQLTEIKDLAKHSKVVAIGEIGLDYYYDFSPKEKQIEAFKSQINLAIELNLPVVIHSRESDEDMLKIIKEYCGSGLKAQFHCYSSPLEYADEYIRMGHFVSFTGNITFKKADELRDTLSKISLEHVMIETDSPFMTPVPHRGKRNEPVYVKLVAEKIAEVHNLSVEDIARFTSYNVFRMFGIGSKPGTSFTYKIRNSLYINVTNRCNADCVFCERKGEAVRSGYNLKMSKDMEPPAEVYIKEIGDPKKYDEIVFCGYGEPTIRWEVVKQVAAYVKDNGGKTRLNTNGHGNYINHKDITPEMKGKIDRVSVSLNTSDPEEYTRIFRVDKKLFDEAIKFIQGSKEYTDKVIVTIVDYDNVNQDKVKKLTDEFGVEFRVREYY
ncbi:MAG: YchF/TatD family DNA exonuclease [Ignavibacteriaceae bacterium]|jgi:TatD DNase family protein